MCVGLTIHSIRPDAVPVGEWRVDENKSASTPTHFDKNNNVSIIHLGSGGPPPSDRPA
jgi:hypothetical protein